MLIYHSREQALGIAHSFGPQFCGSVLYQAFRGPVRVITFSYLGAADVSQQHLLNEVRQKQQEAIASLPTADAQPVRQRRNS